MGVLKRSSAWTTYNPGYADFASGTSVNQGRYRVLGKTVQLSTYLQASGVAFNANALRMFMPFAAGLGLTEQFLTCKLYHATLNDNFMGYLVLPANDLAVGTLYMPRGNASPAITTVNNGIAVGSSLGGSGWTLSVFGAYQIT